MIAWRGREKSGRGGEASGTIAAGGLPGIASRTRRASSRVWVRRYAHCTMRGYHARRDNIPSQFEIATINDSAFRERPFIS